MPIGKPEPALIVLSGLPGVGKTTLARRLSTEIDAVHVRIDTIEAALTASGIVDRAGGWSAVPDTGYRIAYAIALDHLSAGHSVVADSVNPIAITRAAWSRCAKAGRARLLNVEVVCSDLALHRRRVETRTSDLEGLVVPTWQQVEERTYERWDTPVLRVDTAVSIDQAVREITSAMTQADVETPSR
ncbi:AAA family ATPase [Mycolicibacterium sp.]|uniref:AAA family ATPase n=1 Tax=Mycolicibacterium sp. TaxID=2320850 RepID=UPI0037C50C86